MTGADMARALLDDLDDEALEALAARLRHFLTDRDADGLLTTADAADRLGVHPKTIERWCRTGRLTGAVKIGRSWRLRPSALEVLDEPATRPTPDVASRRRRPRAPMTDLAASAILGDQG